MPPALSLAPFAALPTALVLIASLLLSPTNPVIARRPPSKMKKPGSQHHR
jgi:hypothetical protein